MDLYKREYGSGVEQASTGSSSTTHMQRAPLLIVHGLFGSSDNWHGIAQKLSADRPVITMDLPNHGRSEHFPRADYQLLSEAVVQVAREAASSPVILGHSMGGKAAMLAALQEPRLCAGLLIADIAPVRYPPRHQAILKGLEALGAQDVTDRREGDELLAQYVPDKLVRAFLLKNLAPADGGYRLRINEKALREDYEAIAGFPDTELRPYEGPVRVIRGTESDYVAAGLEPFKPLFPHAELVSIEKAGHWLHAEDPEAFLGAVSEFLDLVDAADAGDAAGDRAAQQGATS